MQLKRFEFGALDYILKPIADDEFREAVQKAIESKSKETHLETLVSVSQGHYKGTDDQKIVLKTTDAVYALPQEDILYCQSDGNYTTVHTKEIGEILVSKHIKKIEELLPLQQFIRCHQSYIVNRQHVVKYSKQGYLLLQEGIQVPVSARRKDFVLKNIF